MEKCFFVCPAEMYNKHQTLFIPSLPPSAPLPSTSGRSHAPGANSSGGGASHYRPAPYLNNIQNFVQDFLISVTGANGAIATVGNGGGIGGGGGVGLTRAAGPGASMYFMSHPDDYVLNRDGLDTVITQLLNQFEGMGPAPLDGHRIAQLPSVPVTGDQVAEKLQCSVCWEDFALDESVRKLPCSVSSVCCYIHILNSVRQHLSVFTFTAHVPRAVHRAVAALACHVSGVPTAAEQR